MKVIAALLPVLIFTCSAQFCQARLGEADTKCESRYNPDGKQTQPSYEDTKYPLNIGEPLETLTYTYQGWKIRIGFIRTMARCMEYSISDFKAPSAAELEAIFKANGPSVAWQRISPEQSKTNAVLAELRRYAEKDYWLRSDGSIAYLKRGILKDTILRLEHKVAVDIGLKHMRERESAKKEKETVPTF
jgi:hypothetical protein